tara:strand:- start:99 stop:617 length:519 start_codon:yes stop_codon:yes gene_type:complete
MSSILKVDTLQTTAGAAPNLTDMGFSRTNEIIAAYYATSSTSSQSTTSNAFTNITGMSITMTPKLATSKILIQATVAAETYGSYQDRGIRFVIYGGASGTTVKYYSEYDLYDSVDDSQRITKAPLAFIESASDTSARTYKIGFASTTSNANATSRVNQYGEPSQMLVYEIGQ